MRQDLVAERLHTRVSFVSWHISRSRSCSKPHRYFPTVYEPTVFENYVHGASVVAGNKCHTVGG
jgi:hypothetical protein